MLDATGTVIDATAVWREYSDPLIDRSLAGYFHNTEETYGGGIVPNLTVGAWGLEGGQNGFTGEQLTHINHDELRTFTPPPRATVTTTSGWETVSGLTR